MNTDPNVTTIFNQFKSWVDGTNKLDANSIVILIPLLIKCAEVDIPGNGKGLYKKSVVLQVLSLIVDNSTQCSDKEKQDLQKVIVDIMPAMIDVLISVAEKKIDLGKTFGCCMPMFKGA